MTTSNTPESAAVPWKTKDNPEWIRLQEIVARLEGDDRRDLERILFYFTRKNSTVLREHLDAWKAAHRHADRYHGAIGGHMSCSTASTSIGVMETWTCSTCREECFVDDDF